MVMGGVGRSQTWVVVFSIFFSAEDERRRRERERDKGACGQGETVGGKGAGPGDYRGGGGR
jgi:hypothetical protein